MDSSWSPIGVVHRYGSSRPCFDYNSIVRSLPTEPGSFKQRWEDAMVRIDRVAGLILLSLSDARPVYEAVKISPVVWEGLNTAIVGVGVSTLRHPEDGSVLVYDKEKACKVFMESTASSEEGLSDPCSPEFKVDSLMCKSWVGPGTPYFLER